VPSSPAYDETRKLIACARIMEVTSLLHDVIGNKEGNPILALDGLAELQKLLKSEGSQSVKKECEEQGMVAVAFNNFHRWPEDAEMHRLSLDILVTCEPHVQGRHLKRLVQILARYRDDLPIARSSIHLSMAIIRRGKSERRKSIAVGIVTKLIGVLVRHWTGDARLAADVLRSLAGVALDALGLALVLEQSIVSLTLKIMRAYPRESELQASAVELLARACSSQDGLRQILAYDGVSIVFEALKSIISDEELQLDGLEMMKLVASDPRGREQLSRTTGAWAWLCQIGIGARIHGSRGWTISEEENLVPGIVCVHTEWTPQKLYEFMCLGREHDSAAKGPESRAYFEAVKELSLLPVEGENKYDWFSRVREFESASGLDLRGSLVLLSTSPRGG
jgi:hypothetical protein